MFSKRLIVNVAAAGVAFSAAAATQAATIIDVNPSNGLGHEETIQNVTYQESYSASPWVQNPQATGIHTKDDRAVFVNNVTINGNNLNVFNFEGAEVRNINIAPSVTGLSVFDNGGSVNATGNISGWADAVVGTTQDADLMNYIRYDGTSGLPNSSTADFDLLFKHSFTTDDYVLVAERNGNTFFELTPLDATGNVIAGANILRFGHPKDNAHTVYDWRSGYAAASDQGGSQDIGFSVADVDKFFEGTSVAPADQLVYGFRIDNNGDADVKFFGLSDNTFTDNPTNPLLTGSPAPVPSPAAVWVGVGLACSTLLRRRRK